MVQYVRHGLNGYMTELFSDRFVDRNGTQVSFNLKATAAGPAKLDPKQTSPQSAARLSRRSSSSSGDELFKVPFYSPEILSSYRDYRGQMKRSGRKRITDLDKLISVLENESLSGPDAELLLGFPKSNGDRPWCSTE